MTLINKAKEYFYQKDYKKALELFIKLKDYYSCGLCYLLLEDIENAKKYWNKNKNSCLGCSFGLCVVDLINSRVIRYPSFFETRAFIEVYLNLFLDNELIEWAQNLVNCCDELYKCNPEVYKFIARALFANGYFDLATKFCKKSLTIFYSDPEALLILSQCQFLLGDLGEALDSVNKLLSFVDNYYPAKLFKRIIKEEIEKKYEKS